LLASRLGAQAELRFLGDVASGAFDVEPVHAVDWLRIADLVSRYSDLPLGTIDASVIACVERLGVDESPRSTAATSLSSRHIVSWPSCPSPLARRCGQDRSHPGVSVSTMPGRPAVLGRSRFLVSLVDIGGQVWRTKNRPQRTDRLRHKLILRRTLLEAVQLLPIRRRLVSRTVVAMTGELSFFELGVGDTGRAREFYSSLFGWEFVDQGGGATIETPNIPGGLHGGDQGASPLVFFRVDDLDDALARVRALGGALSDDLGGADPDTVARFGRFALCVDDQGSSFGLHEPPRETHRA
jgi:predicted enzyme related to lactoylglutathione lyase